MIALILRFLGSGVLSRALSSVDRHIANESDRERIKADLIAEHLRTRGDFMRSGGMWLMLLFAIPLAIWFSAVCVYSLLWCARCVFPQTWSIAALPAPLDEWAGLIIMSIFGVVGLTRFK